jgi:hypothetical protein
MMISIRIATLSVVVSLAAGASAPHAQRGSPSAPSTPSTSVLADHLLVTWYGNPHSAKMGILGVRKGADLAAGLKVQAAEYAKVTTKQVLMAYELVTVVAQGLPGKDEKYRRRESSDVIRSLLADARANGFKLILDVQPGRSTVADEVAALRPFLGEPDVYLALDPEFSMMGDKVPGRVIGTMRASDVNDALNILERIISDGHLPPKVLIVHQFTWAMLPDKKNIRSSAPVDVVLDMDGFSDRSLKLSTYRSILKQGTLPLTGFKLFYKQDTNLFAPSQVMALTPAPSVVIYQ